jgi:hypothetical protein
LTTIRLDVFGRRGAVMTHKVNVSTMLRAIAAAGVGSHRLADASAD